MSTLKLAGGDLALENGGLVILSDLTAETAQRLETKFRFFLGEWHLDRRVGFPHYEAVLVKAPNLNQIKALIRQTLLADEGVQGVNTLVMDFDRQLRLLSVSFEVTLIDGTTLEIKDFILSENA